MPLKPLDFSRGPLLLGVVNVTPDSFSDGGKFLSPDAAVAHAARLVEEGADLLDVGGESTRPGAPGVPPEIELQRVLPVVRELARRFPKIPVSVDTSKASVARACLEAGASLVNDVTALRGDPAMAEVVRESGASVVLMHMQGDPRTMQADPAYQDVVGDIISFFRERLAFAASRGVGEERTLLDPGIGFGKTVEHNLEILRRLEEFKALGRPLVVGASRKSFLGALTQDGGAAPGPDERLEGTLAAHLAAAARGASVLRVHDVKAHRRALAVWNAIASPPER
jgi:dihydropteroate synthase